MLFRAAVSFSLGIVVYEKGDDASNDTVDFVLEAGAKNQGDARRLFELFKTDRKADPVMKQMLGAELRLADKSSPGCQAADLMLGGAYRQELLEHGIDASTIEESPSLPPTSRSAPTRSRPSACPLVRKSSPRSAPTSSPRRPHAGGSTRPDAGADRRALRGERADRQLQQGGGESVDHRPHGGGGLIGRRSRAFRSRVP